MYRVPNSLPASLASLSFASVRGRAPFLCCIAGRRRIGPANPERERESGSKEAEKESRTVAGREDNSARVNTGIMDKILINIPPKNVTLFVRVFLGAQLSAYTIPHGPFEEGGGIIATWRRGKEEYGLQTLVGRHRGSNPGPPACESGGVVTITLQRPPHITLLIVFATMNFLYPNEFGLSEGCLA